jgi:coenzyme PQQ precursor peptide PqqA
MPSGLVRPGSSHLRRITMKWTKPEAEVVAVTMEVTAYVATL